MKPISEMQAKAQLSAGIEADIQKYLASGGEIKKVHIGATADSGACKAFTINHRTSPARSRTKKRTPQ